MAQDATSTTPSQWSAYRRSSTALWSNVGIGNTKPQIATRYSETAKVRKQSQLSCNGGVVGNACCSFLNFEPCGRNPNARAWWVLDPRTNQYIALWDAVTTIALLFTAIVTPYEVGFLDPPPAELRWRNPLFLTNRIIDLIFITDMLLQFCLGYATGSVNEGAKYWEFDAGRIAKHYIFSWWFLLDTFSISTSLFDIVGGSDAKSLSGLRAVRVLRLIKLIRLTKSSKIFKRWEMRMSINYAYLAIFTTVVQIFMFSHWFACVWGLQAQWDPLGTWLGVEEYCIPWGGAALPYEDALAQLNTVNVTCPAGRNCENMRRFIGDCDADDICGIGRACMPPEATYVYSLYFSVMTVTSVGYGDIAASPFKPIEQIICTMMMLVGGLIWSQLIGTFCGVAATLSPGTKEFRDRLHHLNSFMENHRIPHQMRFRLREYMHESVHLSHASRNRELLARLSKQMNYEVSWFVNRTWLEKVWYLSDDTEAKRDILIKLASCLEAAVFAPGETAPPGHMYIVSRGIVLHNCRVRRTGQVWGEDILLNSPRLQEWFPALAMSYLWVYRMDGPTLWKILDEYDDSDAVKPIKYARAKWIVKRGLQLFYTVYREKLKRVSQGLEDESTLPLSVRGQKHLAFERERHPLAPKSAEETDLTKLAKLRAEDDALLQRLLGPVEEDAVEPSAGGALADATDDNGKSSTGGAGGASGSDVAEKSGGMSPQINKEIKEMRNDMRRMNATIDQLARSVATLATASITRAAPSAPAPRANKAVSLAPEEEEDDAESRSASPPPSEQAPVSAARTSESLKKKTDEARQLFAAFRQERSLMPSFALTSDSGGGSSSSQAQEQPAAAVATAPPPDASAKRKGGRSLRPTGGRRTSGRSVPAESLSV